MTARRAFALLLAVSLLGAGLAYAARRQVFDPRTEQMLDAAARMEQCLKAIQTEKTARGLPIGGADDPLQTGLIGDSYSPITTTLGSLPAKRTAALPDMAALCVRLLSDAGVQADDTIGACFSGSFPGLDIALLCAADALGVTARYTISVGASTYGANQAAFTAPEMLLLLYEKGLVSAPPLLITPGGQNDRGENMGAAYFADEMPAVEAAYARIRAAGGVLVIPSDFLESVRLREEGYGAIDAFVSIGGHDAAMGADGEGYLLGEGLIKKTPARVTEQSGLLARYRAQGTPALSLLNVRALCERYGIPFDPSTRPENGTSALYFVTAYAWPLIALPLACASALLIYLLLVHKKKEDAPMQDTLIPLLDRYDTATDKKSRVLLLNAAYQMAQKSGCPPLGQILGEEAAARFLSAADALQNEENEGGTALCTPEMLLSIPDEALSLLKRYFLYYKP